MKANVQKAVKLLAALDIEVRSNGVLANNDYEIAFANFQSYMAIRKVLDRQAKSKLKNGSRTYTCGPGFLTIEFMGLLGNIITLHTTNS